MRAFPLAAVTVLFAVLAFPAFAQKGGDHGNGNPGKGHSNPGAADNRGPSQQDNRGQAQAVPGSHDSFVVVDRDRTAVSSYYRDEFARGNCPPGLAKKDNGCLPPGQAKKMWVVGQPLPPAVVYYPLPQPLYSQLTPPPLGYEYVRVDDDVLLMQTTNRSVLNLVVNLR
jgi:Ni/Co efflux regulator RcnB